MAIKFKYRGELFIADTPEEAVRMRALLKKQDEQGERDRFAKGVMDNIREKYREAEIQAAELQWTPALFRRFIERLGRPQQTALSVLVTRHYMEDEELREALNVPDNQTLAGVLSGISKQATSIGIPFRAIFTFQNFRNGGKRRSTYAITNNFLEIATEMNWPSPTQK
jgi:hypothetical protein